MDYCDNYDDDNFKLIFNNVYFSWPGQKYSIIQNCNFSVLKPGFWMLVGENGSGKSTLIKLIQGIIKPSQGLISRPKKMAMVFQNPDHQILMPTCGSELILNIKGNKSKRNIDEMVNNALSEVGLQGFLKRPVHTLSGGQKQRLAIASALISDSNFILMDEPTALLDKNSQIKILEIIKSLTVDKNRPLSIFWITHRLEELTYADRVAVMKDGKLTKWENPNNLKDI